MEQTKENILSAVTLAATANVSNLTSDRINALTGGHGMVNMAVHTAANSITQDLLQGQKVSIEFADVKRLPVADVIEKAIKAAKGAGADGANAALIVASLMYMAGSKAQVGIPAGNRKLGATCRMLAGVDRSGVAAVPTAKMNSKISGFAAVSAIYEAMQKGELTEIDGINIPTFVGGGPLYGHSTLGEDIVWPQLARNGARIGTEAMMNAMRGVGMQPHPFTCAVLGSAAILEIIHPDAEVPEGEGDYGRTTSVYLVGKSAVETAGLPEKVHMKVTGEEFDTAKLIGDLGLIIKDIGAPSVIGMMAFDEIFSCFEEMIAGFSGTPLNSPIGHVATYAVIAMKGLLANQGEQDAFAKEMREERMATTVDPESAITTINIIAHKAHELHPGPVTETLLKMSETPRNQAILRRAHVAYDQYQDGKSVEEVMEAFEQERLHTVETNANRLLTGMMGEDVEVEVLKVTQGARRTAKVARKYFAFDAYADVRVKVGDKEVIMEDFIAGRIPEIAKGEREDIAWAAFPAAMVVTELTLASVYIADLIVTASMAAALGLKTPDEAAKAANKVSIFSAAIPGAIPRARNVGEMACDMLEIN